MSDWKIRTRMLIGNNSVEKLSLSHVAVVGVGGVGGFAVESLARTGVGKITIVDHDVVSESNINRQICATRSSIGRAKTEVMLERIRDINPDCAVSSMFWKYTAENQEMFFSTNYDYIIDAIDIVTCKLDLIETAISRKIPIISSLGTGNKFEPSKLRISDISKTQTCPLAKVIRKELRTRGIINHDVLWSDEIPAKPEMLELPPEGKKSVPASICWVPATAGLMLAGEVINRLIRD